MFAFAVYDNKENNLFLVRDRAGEKPLYYSLINNNFIFASEIKTFKCFKYFNNQINLSAVSEIIDQGYISAPNSIYSDIKKLKPGHYIKFNKNLFSISINKYWKFKENYKYNIKNNSIKIEDEVESILQKSIKNQLHADVPVGVFLSGGIDSSLIAAISKIHDDKIKTFSIGFNDLDYNEAESSKKIANYIGTQHNEFYLSSRNALDLIPKMHEIYCEPFGDSSQIPTYLISKIARENVKVILSGDGGDELFGGYNRYIYGHRYNLISKLLPMFLKDKLSSFILNSNINNLKYIYNFSKFFLPNKFHLTNFSDKIIKVGKTINANSLEDFYYKLTSNNYLYGNILNHNFKNKPRIYKNNDLELMFDNDFNHYLPDDILCKVDRASMANSLEVRAPFLSKNLIEFSGSINFNKKVSFSNGKLPLRKLLKKFLPNQLISQNKRGFAIPLNKWLRGDLREWAEDLISKKNINNYDFFNYDEVNKIWTHHIEGSQENQNILWPLLMFQSWITNK